MREEESELTVSVSRKRLHLSLSLCLSSPSSSEREGDRETRDRQRQAKRQGENVTDDICVSVFISCISLPLTPFFFSSNFFLFFRLMPLCLCLLRVVCDCNRIRSLRSQQMPQSLSESSDPMEGPQKQFCSNEQYKLAA